MSEFIVKNKRNGGCPICLGTSGDCRETITDKGDSLYFCKNNHGEIPGYNYIGDSSCGLWGKFFIDNREEWKREQNWEREGTAYTRKIVSDKPKVTSPEPNQLPREKRHEYYSEIFAQLSLSDRDKKDLLKRGLTDQDIQDGGFKSISNFTVLKKSYYNLPGIKCNRFITYHSGYIIPIRDIDGFYVGYQQRLFDVSDGKYRWAKGCHTLEHNELPLQHCINNPDDPWITLTEAVLKPFIANKRLGINTCGASGGQFASSKETLLKIVEKYPDKSIRIAPDAGSKANRQVLNQYRKTHKLMEQIGLTLWVLDYDQGYDKSKPDIDEIESIPKNARNIPYKDWDVLAWLELPTWDDLDDEDPENWKNKQAVTAHYTWFKNKKFTSDVKINIAKCPDTFVDHKDDRKQVTFPGRKQAIALKLYTGQGKTTAILRQLNTTYSDKECLYINHRNSLGEQFVKDCDEYITKDGGGKGDPRRFYMLNDINNPHYQRLVLCADSLNKFNPKDFDDKVIILDEVESLLRHITGGGTLGDRQQEIMSLFEEMVRRCYALILADANLSDYTCSFIQELTGIRPSKVDNEKLPERPKVFFYEETKGNPKYLIGKAYRESFPWVMTDSNIDSKTICRDALENYGKKYLEINADTINDDENPDRKKWIRAFLENPDIVDDPVVFPYDGIVSSPTIESGLSSTSPRFSGVYLFIKHLESLYSSQMIMRSRNINCPRYVSIKDFCISSDYDSSLKSPFSRQLAKNHLEALTMAQELFISGKVERENIKDILADIVAKSVDNPWVKLHHYHQAITNYEKQNLKACALEALQDQGFTIEMMPEVPEDAKSVNYVKCKRAEKVEDSEKIFNAESITPEQYERFSRRTDLKPKEKASMEKFKILSQMPGIENDKDNWSVSLIHHLKYKNTHAIKQAELRTLCGIEELAKLRSAKSWEKILNKNKFLGKFNDRHLMVRHLIKKNILGVLTSFVDKEYTKETPEIVDLWEKWDRKDAVATKIDRGASPTTLIKRLASRLGFIAYEIEKDDKENIRYFSLADNFTDGYEAVILDYVKVALDTELKRRQSEAMPQDDSVKQQDSAPEAVPPATIQKGVIKKHLNDYLMDKRCDKLMGKKISEGKALLDEAIRYCQAQLGEIEEAGEIVSIAYDLAMADKLILITPAIITTA